MGDKPVVRVGQIWKSTDKRREPRLYRVTAVIGEHVTVCSKFPKQKWDDCDSHQIAIHRFCAKGHMALMEDAPAAPKVEPPKPKPPEPEKKEEKPVAVEKAALTPKQSENLRQQIIEDATAISRAVKNVDQWMGRMAENLFQVRETGCWREWVSTKTHKKFRTFDEWTQEDTGMAKGTIYGLIGIREYVPLPPAQLEAIGKSRAYELKRLGKTKPRLLRDAAKQVLDKDLSVQETKAMVDTAIASDSLRPQSLASFVFLVVSSEAQTVQKAMDVAQHREPVQNVNDDKVLWGVHLVSLCQEYLREEESIKAAKELEESGGTNFSVKD